jgi:hypothetical protein
MYDCFMWHFEQPKALNAYGIDATTAQSFALFQLHPNVDQTAWKRMEVQNSLRIGGRENWTVDVSIAQAIFFFYQQERLYSFKL